MNFRHYTDQSVELAIDLVNTFDIPYQTDDLTEVEGLEKFMAEHELTGEVDDGELARVRELRTALRRVFEAQTDKEAADILNRLLDEADATPWISAHDDSPIHMHFEPARASVADRLAATTAMALAVVLCDFGRDRLGICASDSCRFAFIDVSRTAVSNTAATSARRGKTSPPTGRAAAKRNKASRPN